MIRHLLHAMQLRWSNFEDVYVCCKISAITAMHFFRSTLHKKLCHLQRDAWIIYTGRGMWSRTWVGLTLIVTVPPTTFPCSYAYTAWFSYAPAESGWQWNNQKQSQPNPSPRPDAPPCIQTSFFLFIVLSTCQSLGLFGVINWSLVGQWTAMYHADTCVHLCGPPLWV